MCIVINCNISTSANRRAAAEEETESLRSYISRASISSKRTFLSDERTVITEVFLPLMKLGKFLDGCDVDKLAIKEMPELFSKHGSVKIRNKYRDFKARVKKNPSKYQIE